MAKFILYLASCALLLHALSWRTATGSPVRAPHTQSAERCARQSSLSKTLVHNIRELLNDQAEETLFSGFACSNRAVEVYNKTQTALACAPVLTQNASCSSLTKTTFNERDCVVNVMDDLRHYAAVLRSYQVHLGSHEHRALLNPTLETIHKLTESCSLETTHQQDSSQSYSSMWPNQAFDSRVHLCKMVKGFYIRALTINRAMGYISSGDHRK